MSEAIRVFVGSDLAQQECGMERVLEYSIRKHASRPVEVIFMRAGDNFPVSDTIQPGHWCLHRKSGQAWPKKGSGTDFSMFRCAVPEMAGFHGKAIYLDVDMVLLGDIAELYDHPQNRPWLCNRDHRTEVSLFQCEAFYRQDWPRIEKMQQTGVMLPQMRQHAYNLGLMDMSLGWEWNSCDCVVPGAKLLHATSVPTQLFHCYPNVMYRPHPNEQFKQTFQAVIDEALGAARTDP